MLAILTSSILICWYFPPSDNLVLVSQFQSGEQLLNYFLQRVLALILEEIAIDHVNKEQSRQLLRRAEELHQSALALAVGAFGEMNVQTAKHYGNLGRLYQVRILLGPTTFPLNGQLPFARSSKSSIRLSWSGFECLVLVVFCCIRKTK